MAHDTPEHNTLPEHIEHIERFLANVRHDLRNPLTTIVILVDLLKERLRKEGNSQISANLEDISQAAESLAKMIEGLDERWRAYREE